MLILGNDPLSRFLNQAKGRPFVWGSFDCLMWLADWIVAVRGVDVAEEWRDTYHTRVGAWRIVREAGGMAAHIDRCTEPFGIARTSTAKRGDIGIVELPEGPTGVIVVKSSVALFASPGKLMLAKVPVQTAWSV